MKVKNYVSQVSNRVTPLILTVLLGLIASETLHADTCSLKKNDLLVDSKALMEKVMSESTTKDDGFQKVSYSPSKQNVLDHKFHNIDRTRPYFDDMNGIGIITGSTFSNKPQTYGSATLISSCYVLTNKHVVKGLLSEKGRNLKTGESFNFSVGQTKNCTSENHFEAMNQEVTLVDHGLDETSGNIIQNDWAILKLKKPIKNVKPVSLGSAYFKNDQMLVRAGYPYQVVKGTGTFANLSGQYLQNEEFSAGIGIASDKVSRPGMSGGPAFYTKFVDGIPKAYFAGITVGTVESGKTAILPMLTLKAGIKESGKYTWSEITKQTDTETCD